MANYANLKSAIQQVVKTNGNQEITGALLQQSLLAMVNALGQYFQFAGLATPTTNPGTPDQNVFYIASTAGTYSNFGPIVLNNGEIVFFTYNGSWTKLLFGAASQQSVAELQSVVESVALDARAAFAQSGGVRKFGVNVTSGQELSKDVKYPVNIPANTPFKAKLINASGLISGGSVAYYIWSNGVRTYGGGLSETESTITKTVDIDAISFYKAAGSVTGTGTFDVQITADGVLGSQIASIQQYSERKIELLVWIGASSAGHNTWVVGEKMFNTSLNKIRVCTVPSPNQDFGISYDASKESLYLYNGALYQWDGNNMTPITDVSVIALGKEVDGVKLSVYGEGSNTYPVTAGVQIDGTDINSPYVFPISLLQGEKFKISKTSSVVGNITVYAIKSDNTHTSLGAVGNTEVEKTAPFDMVGIGVYILAERISGNGEYTLTVKKTSLAQTQQDVTELQSKSAVWDGNKNQIERLPENRIFDASLFAIGDLWHGIPDTSVKYRVYMTQKQTAQKDILLSALPGFRFWVEFYENDIWVRSLEAQTVYLIPRNSVFQIKIGHTAPEDTSITADIQTYVASVVYPTDFYTEFKGNGQLEYYGQKIASLSLLSKSFRCFEETLVTEKKGSSDNYMTSGMVVYNGKAFCFTDNMDGVSYCCVFDLATKTQIYKATLPWAAHNNNAQPTPYFYDPNDTYPLFLISYGNYAGGEQKFIFVRVVESSGTFTFTVVKEISYSGFAGAAYNNSWFANYEKNELYCYGYPNGSWAVTSNNPIIFNIFDMVSLDNYDPVTLTGDDVKKIITLQDHWIMQSALYHNDKIFVQVEADGSWQSITINGQPYDFSKGRHFLFVINANSGYIETIVPIHGDQEQEGMSMCDGALYMSEKYTNAAQGNVCFRLVKYMFE